MYSSCFVLFKLLIISSLLLGLLIIVDDFVVCIGEDENAGADEGRH